MMLMALMLTSENSLPSDKGAYQSRLKFHLIAAGH